MSDMTIPKSTQALLVVCLHHFLHEEFKIAPSFEYNDGANDSERDFAVLASAFLEDNVEVIFGECKTAESFADASASVADAALPDLQQKDDMRKLGERTGAHLAFCTLASDFSDADKEFFKELVRDKQKLILLTRKHLEMDYIAASQYTREGRAILKDVEQLSRLTVIDCLGADFAKSQHIWI